MLGEGTNSSKDFSINSITRYVNVIDSHLIKLFQLDKTISKGLLSQQSVSFSLSIRITNSKPGFCLSICVQEEGVYIFKPLKDYLHFNDETIKGGENCITVHKLNKSLYFTRLQPNKQTRVSHINESGVSLIYILLHSNSVLYQLSTAQYFFQISSVFPVTGIWARCQNDQVIENKV